MTTPLSISESTIALARRGPAAARQGPDNLKNVRNIVAVGSGKGGVGKSTVAVHLAAALARAGARVGLLDADIYGPTIPGLLGVKDKRLAGDTEVLEPLVVQGIKLVSVGMLMDADGPLVWRAPMATRLVENFISGVAWGDLDYLLIDLPPGTGDVQLTLAQRAHLTGAVIVTTPQSTALDIARKGLQMFEQVKVPILGVVENMSGLVCAKCGHREAFFSEGGGVRLAEERRCPFLGAVPLDADLVRAGEAGKPVWVHNAGAASARSFEAVARAFEEGVAALNGAAGGEPRAVRLSPRGGLEIEWPDGKTTRHGARALRLACVCAACKDEVSGADLLRPETVPAEIRVMKASAVGRYGVAVEFTDGHNTGIYHFDRLPGIGEDPAGNAPAPVPPAAPGDMRVRVEEVIRRDVAPGLAGHGGRVEVAAVEQGVVAVRFAGGCQGCGAAQATLKAGVEQALRRAIPEILRVIDITDHQAGAQPYYPSSQPGQSPFEKGR
jgi:ATP-binding protein involved in chromosome partitioning